MLATPITGWTDGREPIPVDVSGVKNVPSLIRAIKKAAGNLLPDSVKDAEFRAEIARVFVKNARAAAAQGYRVPRWVLNRLPNQRVVFPVLGIAFFAIHGIYFAVPVSTIIVAVIASIVLMTVAISAAIKAMVEEVKEKTKDRI